MADDNDNDNDNDNEEGDDEGGGKKKKLFMLVGVVAVAGAAYQFVLKSPPPDDDAAALGEPAEVTPVEGEIVALEQMILNIEGQNAGYLRIGLALVLEEGTLAADFQTETAIAEDVAVQFLSSQTSERLRSAEGRQAAKKELSALIREAYGDEKVVRVLFTALVMQ